MKISWYGLILISAFSVLALQSCSTLSQDECKAMNWQERGFSDGSNGKPASQINDYQETCAKYSMKVDQAQYTKGRAQGLKVFCTFENGRLQGDSGYLNSKGVCPPDLAVEFMKGYQIGQADRRAREAEAARKKAEEERKAAEAREVQRLQNLSTTSCHTDYDCEVKQTCAQYRCSRTSMPCTYDSDCSVSRGRCNIKTETYAGRSFNIGSCSY